MYKIFCNHKEYEIKYAQDVISFINDKKIQMEKNSSPQIVIIKSDKTKAYLEIGIGIKDESILFFVPASDYDDMKISCCNNKELINSKNDIEFTTFKGSKFYCSKYNLIEYNKALEELKYYLNYNKISKHITWYAY